MNRKLFFFAFLAGVISVNATCQVNMQKGSFETSIPLYNFKDPLSNLSFNLSLDYSSGNGIQVDETPSCIGQGWNLGGLGVITRIQRGTAPDDQKERQGPWSDIYKYPNGYIFNTKPVTAGCPKMLNIYPNFKPKITWVNGWPQENPHTFYNDDNIVNADREQDYFVFSFNGRYGKFVIDKNQNIHVLGDVRLKFRNPEFDTEPVNNCRTLIKKFVIIDEYGIEYEFAERDYAKNYLYKSDIQKPYFIYAQEIPNSANPYFTNNWYLSKITDPLVKRTITFVYKKDVINMLAGYSTQLYRKLAANSNMYDANGSGIVLPIFQQMADQSCIGRMGDITATENKLYVKKPEILSIDLPNKDRVDFKYYASRSDCPGSFRLQQLEVFKALGANVESYGFEQSYFVKNKIKIPYNSEEEKFSRLALLAVNKIAGNDFQNLAKFDYYLGSEIEDDFVPPIFFHAKDPWGYYNGDYCGVPVNAILNRQSIIHSVPVEVPDGPGSTRCVSVPYAGLLANYNTPYFMENFWWWTNNPNDYYFRSNVKTMYAQNGLLKSIKNIFGGKTIIIYEQNKFHNGELSLGPDFGDSYKSIDADAVGGVHASQINEEEQDNAIETKKITKYNFVKENGITSSLWGIEFPCNLNLTSNYYEAEDKFLDGITCNYHYKCPGEKYLIQGIAINNSGGQFTQAINFLFGSPDKALQVISQAFNGTLDGGRLFTNLWQGVLFNIVQSIFFSCIIGSDPYERTVTAIHSNRIINFQNSLPAQFRRVEVVSSYFNSNRAEWEDNGKIVYDFTSPEDQQFPLLVNYNYPPFTNRTRAHNWAYGLPKSIRTFNRNDFLIKSVENDYQPVTRDFTGTETKSCMCSPTYFKSLRSDQWETQNVNDFTAATIVNNSNNSFYNNYLTAKSPALGVEIYNQSAGHAELKSTTIKEYDKVGNAMETITQYEYSPINFQVSSIITYTNDDRKIEKKIYYPENFDLPVPGTSAIPLLITNNIVNIPIVTETWQTRGTNKELLSFSAIDFDKVSSGALKPIIEYKLIANAPIPSASAGILGPTSILRNIPEIKPVSTTTYDANGNAVQANNLLASKVASTIYSHDGQYPIGNIINAERNEVAYSSFEDEGGDWAISAGNYAQGAITGGRCLSTNFNIASPAVPNTKKYKLSFWVKTNGPAGTLLVNNQNPDFTGPEINGWKYHEYTLLPGFTTPVVVSGSGSIDEVRLYPINASLNTTTYFPAIGKSSDCDDNNRITYYEYDSFNRLKLIRDSQKNVVKTYDYHYKAN